jgi:hypothetical protein
MLTPKQAAERAGRSERWLRSETAAGHLDGVVVREPHHRPLFHREKLDRWLDERGRG